MKTSYALIAAILAPASQAFASGNTTDQGMSLFAMLFLAFAVLIILFQLVPGVMLFVGMVKGIFSTGEKKAAASNKS